MAEERDRGGELRSFTSEEFTVQLGTRRMHDARSSSSARMDSRVSGRMKNVLPTSGRRSLDTSQNLHSGSWLFHNAVLPASNVA